MTNCNKVLTLCDICVRQISGNAENVTQCEESYQCQLCFGIMDQAMIDKVGEKVQEELTKQPYDSNSFILALNLPVGQTLREILVSRLRPDFNGTLVSVPYKVRNIDGYLKKLGSYSGKRPTLSSDLQLMITFEQDESDFYDLEFLKNEFPNDFRVGKRGRYNNQETPTRCTKQQLQQISGRIDASIAEKYTFKSPTRKCTFSLSFERDPVYIAGRYCKYSRCLPQSPWSEDKDAPRELGNSVSEKICDILKKQFGASDSRFITSGREDIDVRMLGTGRPFVVELRNCRITASVRGTAYVQTLKAVEESINSQKDINVNSLTRVSRELADNLCVGEEEKRKQYCAYCYSILPISDEQFASALSKVPLTIVQKTPVRVIKRRALLDRERVRLETQAGTYIKEFVHGDFGRTRPSLAELLGVEHGEVDILELDVEKVDLEWPPKLKDNEEPVRFR